jgi:hypothetical protein
MVDAEEQQAYFKRSVRFADDNLCSFHDGAVMDMIDSTREIWYQHADLSHIKRKAMVVSKEALRYGFGSLLTNTYGNSTEETQEALNAWSRSANNRRGLERWINDEYSAKRSDIRRRTIQSVLRAQEKMRQENIHDTDYGAKVLSRLSEAFSQDSRNFAHAMGKADALAVLFTEATNSSSSSATPSAEKVRAASTIMRAPHRAPSPRSVIINRAPRKSLGLSGEGDFRNFV